MKFMIRPLVISLAVWQLLLYSANTVTKHLSVFGSKWGELIESGVLIGTLPAKSSLLIDWTVKDDKNPAWILSDNDNDDYYKDGDDDKVSSVFRKARKPQTSPINATDSNPGKKQRPQQETARAGEVSDSQVRIQETKSVAPLQAENIDSKKNMPQMIIHIGPSKTGTSTIQKESADLLSKVLETDNYYYVGKFGDRGRRRGAKIPNLLDEDACFQEATNDWIENKTTSFDETDCWKNRISGIETYRERNENLILSDESYSYVSKYATNKISPHYYEMLRIALKDWSVVVVPTYRRYYEWVLSVAKEVNRKGCHQPTVDWDGMRCINLWSQVKTMLARSDFEGHPYTNLDVTVPTWSKAGFNVSILDFHDPKHLTCTFYCDVISGTKNTCNFCLEQASDQHNKQEVSMTAYNEIVFEAATRGIIDTSTANRSRHEVTNDLATFHSVVLGKAFTDLPLLCPSQKILQTLLDKSLAMEKMILPAVFRSPQRIDEHRSSFHLAAQEEKAFCWVDVDTLLRGKTSWEEVLMSLNTTKNWLT